jgi:superfamily II DNA/RNA helicase
VSVAARKVAVLADVLTAKRSTAPSCSLVPKQGADKVACGLVRAGIATEAVHGNKSENQRGGGLAAFRKVGVRTLVATDIAACGIAVDVRARTTGSGAADRQWSADAWPSGCDVSFVPISIDDAYQT